jgi:uncharacterized protein
VPAEVVFLDTAALVAIANSRDSMHARASELQRQLARSGAAFVTSDWVLTELLGFASALGARDAAAAVVRRLRSSHRSEVLEASRESWDRAFELFVDRPDKEWSLVDCASILACRERGIERVLTADHHFEQAGFTILLK